MMGGFTLFGSSDDSTTENITNNNTTNNNYDQREFYEDNSTYSYAEDNSVTNNNLTNTVTDFGAVEGGLNIATAAINGITDVSAGGFDFGTSALDFASESGYEAFQLVKDSQDSSTGFSASALETVAQLSNNIATGGAVTTGQNMQRAMIAVAVVSGLALAAMAWSKRK